MLEKIEAIAAKHNLRIANVFHAGDGNLHPVVLFDERDTDEVKRVLAAGGDILRACVDAGGTLTGEHGIGLEKQEFMGLVFTAEDLELQKRIRDVFNPAGLLNPGKLFPVHNTCCPHLDRPDTAELQLLARGKGSV
jgi:glycolate oxidase